MLIGLLSVSLWNDSDGCFVLDREALDEYLQHHNGLRMGGM